MLERSISQFYNDKCLFVTGATGLLGKSVIEKLLRSCPGVKCIYVLIRPKRGAAVQERLNGLVQSEVFNLLRENDPAVLNKIKAFEGDVLEPNFGLSEADLEELFNNVSIVIHSAATVKFNEPLKLAVNMNLVPVIRLIEIAKRMKRLEVMIHISTAYANCDEKIIHEFIYPPPMNPYKLIEVVDCLNEDILDTIAPALLENKPNTYTFTKQLAEYVISQHLESLPVIIIRPSIIGSSVSEPFPGWVDNFNAATGLIAAISKGMLRSMMGDYTKSANIIPVDTTAKFIIAAGWYSAGTYHTALTNGDSKVYDSCMPNGDVSSAVYDKVEQSIQSSKPRFLSVYNCTLDNDKLTWGTFVKSLLPRVQFSPSVSCQRFPNFHMTTTAWYHDVKWTFSHMIPAAILDFLQLLQGHSPRYMRNMDRLKDVVVRLSYFTLNHWHFVSENKNIIWKAMSEADRKTFNFELSNVDWVSYLNVYLHGTKKYALKENPNTNYTSILRGKKLRLIDFIFRYLSMTVVLLFMMKKIHVFSGIFYQLLHVLVRIFRILKI